MSRNYYGSYCSSESELSSIYSEEECGEIEDEYQHCHETSASSHASYSRSESPDLGPYSEEPLADAAWLREYNEERGKIRETQ